MAPLKKAIIDIPLASGGMDTKIDPKSLPPTKLRTLQNSVVQKTGEVSKRHGYEDITTDATSYNGTIGVSSSIDSATSLYTYKDALVVAGKDTGSLRASNDDDRAEFDGGQLWTYGNAYDNWVGNGKYDPCTFEVDKISRSNDTLANPDVAEGGGFRAYAYQDDGAAYMELIDAVSGTKYLERLLIDNSEHYPHVLYINNPGGMQNIAAVEVMVGLVADPSGEDLNYRIVDLNNPTDQGDKGAHILNTLHSDGYWDVCELEDGYTGPELLIAYESTTPNIKVEATRVKVDDLVTDIGANTVSETVKNHISIFPLKNTQHGKSWKTVHFDSVGVQGNGQWFIGGQDGYFMRAHNDTSKWFSRRAGTPRGRAGGEYGDAYGFHTNGAHAGLGTAGDGYTGLLVHKGGLIQSTTANGFEIYDETSGTTEDLLGIDYNPRQGTHGRFVIVGRNGTILTCDDCYWANADGGGNVTFTAQSENFSTALWDVNVMSDSDDWTVVGEDGYCVVSSDGEVWSNVNTGVTEDLRGVTSDSDLSLWVAVGTAGTIITATDPSGTWTQRTSGVTTHLNAVASIGSCFIAVGDGGVILTSADGITWTSRTSGTTENLNGIDADATNDGVVVCGDNNTVLTSTGGIAWTSVTTGLTRYILSYQDANTGYPEVVAIDSDGSTELIPPKIVNTGEYDEEVINCTGCMSPLTYHALSTPRPVFMISQETWQPWPGNNYVIHLWYSWGELDYITNRRTYHSTLLGKAFVHDNKEHVLLGHDSTLQSTYYLCNFWVRAGAIYPQLVAHVFHGRGGPFRISNLSQCVLNSDNEYMYAMLRQDRLLSDNAVSRSVNGCRFDLTPDALPSTDISPGLEIGGGYIMGFDGKVQELGFMMFPEADNIVFNGTDSTGGFMDDGTRYYRWIYEWTDRLGQIHRSAPSSIKGPVVNSEGTSTQVAEFDAQNYPFFDWENKGTLTLVTYRTVDGAGEAGPFYRSTSTDVIHPTGDNTAVSEGDSDESIEDNEIIYTAGGVLPNDPPPASKIIVARRNRIFLVPMDDPTVLWYSKPKEANVGFEFSEAFQYRFEEGGDIKALATLDDKIIVLKERMIFYFAGEGPNSAGEGSFTTTLPIATDVGCINSNSVVTTNLGIMFKSHKGIYLLDRSLRVHYIGSPVEAYNDYEVKSATLIEDKNRVVFTLSGGQPALVFDYFHGQWSIWLNHNAVDAIIHDGKYTWVNSNGVVKQETTGYTDGNFVIPMKIETSWIKIANLAGNQRVWRMAITGEFKSHHTLTVKIYTDYNDSTLQQTLTFDTTSAYDSGNPLQFRGHIKTQKCQAMKFVIEDDSQAGTFESCTITGITLEVGQKVGVVDLPQDESL
jgi:hypothetical protein